MTDHRFQVEFLLDNFDMFIERLCYSHPLDINTMRQLKDCLKWDLLSFNESIPWTKEMMIEFSDYLDFGNGDQELETKWINLNRAIPWSCELLEIFEDKVQWRELSCMKLIKENSDIRLRFYHKLAPYLCGSEMDKSSGEFSKSQKSLQGDSVNDQDEFSLILDHIEELGKFPELCFHEAAEIESAEKLDWSLLSQNNFLPWSIELIEKYEDQWNWNTLSTNEALPWSSSFIDHFKTKWEWGGLSEPNEFGDRLVSWGLTSNEAIYWNAEMLERFKNAHDWFHISYMKNVDWSIEILYQYQSMLEYEQVLFNDAVWNKIFEGTSVEETITKVLYLYKLEEQLCLN